MTTWNRLMERFRYWYEMRPISRRTAEAFALGVFCICVVLAALFSSATVERTRSDLRATLNQQMNTARINVQSNLKAYNNLLLSTAALLQQKDVITRSEWAKFYHDAHVADAYPRVVGLGYAVRVDAQDIAYQESVATREDGTHISYTPELGSTEPPYTMIIYLEPSNQENTQALGYDMYSEAIRRDAMEKARDYATPVMTAPVVLRQGSDKSLKEGVLIYYPNYGGVIPESVEERRALLKGYVYVVLRPSELLTSYVNTSQVIGQNTRLAVTDRTTPGGKLLYESKPDEEFSDLRISQSSELVFDERTWSVDVSGVYKGAMILWNPWILLGLGGIVGALLAMMVLFLLEKRLYTFQQRFEGEVQRTKEELLALASHQLRTPASGVKQYIAMLRDGMMGDLTKSQQAVAEKAYEANERQIEIIDELLYVSKIDAGKLLIEPHTINVTRLIHVAIDEVSERAAQKDITISFRNTKPVEVIADRRYVMMIIENLLTNAIKYSYPSSPVLVQLKSDVRSVYVVVSDKGVGVPKSKYEDIFDKFSRLDSPLSYEAGGSGLGLFLARQLARAHGGDITVHSEPDGGSEFTLRLSKTLTIDSSIVNITNALPSDRSED